MGISAQGGNGEEGLEQFVLFCVSVRGVEVSVGEGLLVRKMQRWMTSPIKSPSCSAC